MPVCQTWEVEKSDPGFVFAYFCMTYAPFPALQQGWKRSWNSICLNCRLFAEFLWFSMIAEASTKSVRRKAREGRVRRCALSPEEYGVVAQSLAGRTAQVGNRLETKVYRQSLQEWPVLCQLCQMTAWETWHGIAWAFAEAPCPFHIVHWWWKKTSNSFWKIILPNALRCAVFTCKLSDIVEGPRFSELMELSFSLVPGFCSFNLHHDFPAELCVTLFDAPPLLQLSLRNHPRNNSTLPSQEQRSIDHLSILDSKCLGLQKVTRVTRISKTQHIVFASSFRYHQMDSFVHRVRGWIPYESLIECTLRIPAADGLGWKALILGWTDGLQASLLVTLVSSYLFVFFCPANSLVIQQLSPFAFLSSTLNEKRAACLPQS